MRKLLLIIIIIIGVIYVYLFEILENDKNWFKQFSESSKTISNEKFDNIEYGAYRWRIDDNTPDWKLFLAYYIKIEKNGDYLVMRHNTTPEPPQYFKGSIDNFTHKLLDTLQTIHLDSIYINRELKIYDGNTLNLNYNGDKSHVFFYQTDAPLFLQRLSTALDAMIFKSEKEVEHFDLTFYEQKLKQRSLKWLGELPKRESPRFR
jgi:hypothetical protein